MALMFVGAAGSCAVQGITGLSSYRDNPFGAMKDFCERVIVPAKPSGAFATKAQTSGPRQYMKAYAHYIFCSGPEGFQEEQAKRWPSRSEAENTYSYYAIPFAAYIKKYRLGHVATVPRCLNTKFHPTTTCQVWVWQPNQKNLERWYERHVEKIPYTRKKKAKPTAVPEAPHA